MTRQCLHLGRLVTLSLAASVLTVGAPALAEKPDESPAMKVQIDKTTGKLRNATADEAAALDDAAQKQLAADWWNATVPGDDADGVVTLPSGAQMKRMPVESLEAFAIKVDADGKLVGAHVDPDGASIEEVAEVEHEDR